MKNINKDLKSERHNVFTEEIKKIALSSNVDKRIQSLVLPETYAPGMSKDLLCKKEKTKLISIRKQYKWLHLMMLQKKT